MQVDEVVFPEIVLEATRDSHSIGKFRTPQTISGEVLHIVTIVSTTVYLNERFEWILKCA